MSTKKQSDSINRVEQALNALRQGRMIVLADDEHREHEGDIVVAAEKITPQAINFMTQHARGLICLTVTEEIIQRLQLPFMPKRHAQANQAAFAVSIDAVHGITTGISAHDRAHTIQVAVNPNCTADEIAYPGHIFPLQAQSGGVLTRPGHTEGSVDLAQLAGLQPAAVICEIINEDGSMARSEQLKQFARKHDILILSIGDIIEYRLNKSA